MQHTPDGRVGAEEPTPNPASSAIVGRCQALVANPVFDAAMMAVIVINAVVLGMETYGDLAERYGGTFRVVNRVILSIYVVELLIRLTATRWRVKIFVADKWNVFDFTVIVASLVPFVREYAMPLRLLRLVRIIRIIRFLPELRIVIAAIGNSMRGVASLAGATLLLIYVYGMVGWAILGQHDTEHFRNIGQAMLTMFIMLTFSNLVVCIDKGQELSDWTVLYFISYTVVVAFLIFNLFVGIVLNAMSDARSTDRKAHETDDLLARIRAARAALEDAETELRNTRRDDR